MSPRTDLVFRTALVVITVLVIAGLAWLLIQIEEILLAILIAAILAAGVAPIVSRLEKIRWTQRGVRLSRIAAIVLVFLGIIVVLLAVGALLVTPLVIETQQFIANFPQRTAELQAQLVSLHAKYAWLPDLAVYVQRLPQELNNLSRFFAPAAGVAFRFLGGVATVITVLFMAFYMLVEGPAIRSGFAALFPRRERAKIEEVLDQIGAKFGGWLRGQLLLGFIIGLAAWLLTSLIGLPYPVLLGIVAGITELVPMVGPTLGAIPAVFLALFQPPVKILFVIAGYAAIQQAESNFVVPRVMRSAVGLSPLLTILALVIGGKLLGIMGALLGVPVAAALQVVVGEIARRVRPNEWRQSLRSCSFLGVLFDKREGLRQRRGQEGRRLVLAQVGETPAFQKLSECRHEFRQLPRHVGEQVPVGFFGGRISRAGALHQGEIARVQVPVLRIVLMFLPQ